MTNDFDMEKYIEMKREEMRDLFDTLNDSTREIARSDEAYLRYLDVQSRFDLYSVSNSILIAKQKPEATQLKSFDDWRKLDIQIGKGEKGIQILEPYEFDKSDGSKGRGYKVKRVFDISQTNALRRRRGQGLAQRDLLKALIENAPVEIEAVDNVEGDAAARYDHNDGKIYLKAGSDPDVLFKETSRELAHAHFALDNDSYPREEYTDKADTASYMLCKKYGLEITDMKPSLPERYGNMKAREIRNELNDTRRAVCDISGRMRENLKRQREARGNQER